MKVVTFAVYRFDPETDQEPRFDRYQVQVRPYMNVLEGLFEIIDTQDGSLAFRYACRGAVCGSCGMQINGESRLACQTLITSLKADIIKLEPLKLPHLTVIKDLVVDLNPFFQNLDTIQPFLIPDQLPEREFLQSPKQQQLLVNAVNCILCDLCDAACPITHFKKDFIGPATLTKVFRFVFDSRDVTAKDRLEKINNDHYVWGCRTIARCTEVCPRNVSPSRLISALKRKLVTGPPKK